MIFCAVFNPTPGADAMAFASPAATQTASLSAGRVDSTERAAFGPTPDTDSKWMNSARSVSSEKPYSSIASSRTARYANSVASRPSSGESFACVEALTASL